MHVQMQNPQTDAIDVYHRRSHSDAHFESWKPIRLKGGESYRFIVAKSAANEVGFEIAAPSCVHVRLHEVFDRAHFPTVSMEEGRADSDVTPLPAFSGRSIGVGGVASRLT